MSQNNEEVVFPKQTPERKKKVGRRRWARKRSILFHMRNLNVGITEFSLFQQNKRDLVQLYDNIDKLFAEISQDAFSNEKLCIQAIKDIYDSECEYQKKLNQLRGMQLNMQNAPKHVLCKNLQNNNVMCEHGTLRKLCSLESSHQAMAFTSDELNRVFSNLKDIVKVSLNLVRNLQNELEKLYDEQNTLEVSDLVAVFCDVFLKNHEALKEYTIYSNRYVNAFDAHRTLRKNSDIFRNVVSELEKKSKYELSVLLEQPHERVNNYCEGFKKVKELADHSGCLKRNVDKELMKAIEMLKNLNEATNIGD